MNISIWLKSLFTGRSHALLLYRRGMTRARKHDHHGAIEDYTQAIDMPGAPWDVKAMALYNRALVHVSSADEQKGVEDLDAVLAMDKGPINVKTMARQKLIRMESKSGNNS